MGDVYPVDISIVVPVWNEEKVIGNFCFHLFEVLNKLRERSEVIFIDDASTDSSFEILSNIYRGSKQIKVIRLTRNFGQHLALLVGIYYIQGKVVIAIDADLEYSPYDIPKFIKKINEGYDFVFGWRKNYNTGILRFIFLAFLKCFVRPKVHDYTCPLRAMRTIVAEQMRNCGSIDKISAELPNNRCAEIIIEFDRRETKRSSYTLLRKMKLLFQMSFDIIFTGVGQRRRQLNLTSIISQVLS